jgi:hypothetical protein
MKMRSRITEIEMLKALSQTGGYSTVELTKILD